MNVAAPEPCLREIRPGRERAVIADQCLLRPTELEERIPGVEVRFRISRIEVDRLPAAFQPFDEPPEVVERPATVVPGLRIGRRDRQRLLETGKRFFVALE